MSWSCSNYLYLNSDKCATIRFSTSRSDSPLYFIEGLPIPAPSSHRDLGVIVSSNLSWSDHYNYICSKAYSSIYLIRRSFSSNVPTATKKQLYLSLVRSKLSYCSQLWRPQLIKDILLLEKVQRRATKFILNDFSSGYKDRLISLNILPLMYWLELNDIMYLVKSIKYPPDNVSIFEFVSFTNSPSRPNKLKHNYCRTSKARHFYFNRIVRLWNSLPPIDLTRSPRTIKHLLINHLWDHFLTNFEPLNHCTLHYLCPCSSCFTK